MKGWINGLITATVSGAASAAGAVVIDPEHFNGRHLRYLAIVAGAGALLALINYLRQSPWPASKPDLDPRRYITAAVLLGATLLPLTACTVPPTIQTPQARAAFSADVAVQRVGEFQQVVIDLSDAGTINVGDARQIVGWCIDAAIVLRTMPQGPSATIVTGWARVRPQVARVPALQPWLDTIDVLIQGYLAEGR
jgi:hypothetical protein